MTERFLGDADGDLILVVKTGNTGDVASVIFPQGLVQTFVMEHTSKIKSAKIFGRTIVF